jgi:hypothetical protein
MLEPSCKKLKHGRLRKSQSTRQRIVNMGNTLEVNHLQPQVMNQARIRTTAMEVESSTGNDEIDLLSKDLLHHMMDFFVSESGLVDGSSLRSCALVCKRWKEVAYSPSIWSIPASLSKLELEPNSSMATAPATGQGPRCSLASSLVIRELVEPDCSRRVRASSFARREFDWISQSGENKESPHQPSFILVIQEE